MTIDPRLAQRRHRVAETRARSRLARSIAVLAVGAVVAAGLWLLRSPFLSVERVDLSGAIASKAADILVDAGVVPGRPLVDVDPDAVRSALLADLWIADATVKRDWPDRVEVLVVERFPIAWVETPSGWLHLAPDGTILERGVPPEGAPLIRVADLQATEASNNRMVLAALEFTDAVRADLTTGLSIRATSEEMSAAVAGYAVRLGRPIDMTAKARALAAILDDRPEAGSEITLVAPTRPAVRPPEPEIPPTEG